MRKLGAVAIAIAIVLLSLPVLATQTEVIYQGYYTVAWELPETGKWPQAYEAHVYTNETPNLAALDGHLASLCGTYQVDVYNINSEKDALTLAGLLEREVLDLNDNGLPEDNKIWQSSKLVTATECGTTSSSSSSTTTVDSTTSTSTPSTSSSSTSSSTSTSVSPTTSSTEPMAELPFTGLRAETLLSAVALLALGLTFIKVSRRVAR